MNYDGIGITTHDLQMGTSFLTKLAGEASFPFLSATIISKENNVPVFTPHTIIQKNNIAIGVIGLTAKTKQYAKQNFKVIDWQRPLQKSIQLLADVDLIIVLSNLSHQENQTIAKSYPAVNIILEAGQSLNVPQIQLQDNTLISHTPREGKYIGELQINWQESKTWQTAKNSLIQLKNEIDRLKWFQNRINKRGGPEKAYKENQKALNEYNKKMQRLQELEAQLTALQSTQSTALKTSTYERFLHPLKPSIPDEPQTIKILKSSRKATNKLRRKTDMLKHFADYAGSSACKKCHAEIYTAYQTTRHSRAYPTLVKKSQNNNPNCVFCHVTGLPERLAHIQAKMPARLLEVGCETCHGPGKQHVKEPTRYKLKQKVAETLCLTCHTEDHSDDFNYDRDIELVH